MTSTPICRCRVLYLGSSVPHVTKDGINGIQEPLSDLYPEEGITGRAYGIDSWLSVWSNGILIENVDEKLKCVRRFFPIDNLHYCAAVRHVTVSNGIHQPEAANSINRAITKQFLPLDSPLARIPSPTNPPIFACILRRTSGIKVLECHVFVCKKETAANALVRCCFNAYADNTLAKQLESENTPALSGKGEIENAMNPIQKVKQWQESSSLSNNGQLTDDNSKSWTGTLKSNSNGQNGSNDNDYASIYAEFTTGTLRSVKSNNSRPRQLTAPSNPPPPPPTQSFEDTKVENKWSLPFEFEWPPESSHELLPQLSPQYISSALSPSGHYLPTNNKFNSSTIQRMKNVLGEPIYVPVNGRPFNSVENPYHPRGFPYGDDETHSLALPRNGNAFLENHKKDGEKEMQRQAIQNSYTNHSKNGAKKDSRLSSGSSNGDQQSHNGHAKTNTLPSNKEAKFQLQIARDLKNLSLSEGETQENYKMEKNKKIHKKTAISNLKIASGKRRKKTQPNDK
ncbi:hypothetical protein CHUAL_005433 [Chamberlinius hualienensis]